MTRPYRLSARAERQQATRRRIIDAAIELHSTIGPARTSLSAVAEHAGLSRPTIYAYFPDMPSLFAACSQAATAEDPWPDPQGWLVVRDPLGRLRHALAELYAHYRRNEQLTANIVRDLDLLPRVPGRDLDDVYASMRMALASGWRIRGRRRRLLLAALEHAINFQSWQSLAASHELADEDVIELMTALVLAAAHPAPAPTRARAVATRR